MFKFICKIYTLMHSDKLKFNIIIVEYVVLSPRPLPNSFSKGKDKCSRNCAEYSIFCAWYQNTLLIQIYLYWKKNVSNIYINTLGMILVIALVSMMSYRNLYFPFFLIKSKYQSSETETTWGSLFRLRILKIIVWSLSDHCLLQQMSVEWILREMNFDELMTQNKCS